MARMLRPLIAATVWAGLASTPTWAAGLPGVKISAGNPVPACATAGRLMAFVKTRNPGLDQRFEGVAAEYKRHGEQLGMRWDIAFFQMLSETGDLTFSKGGRQSVQAEQNNFAGLGAASNSQAGESFADVSSGVRAHLEHLLVYAGQRVDNPVAERTRKVQEWGVLKSWQQKLSGPASYQDVFFHWANKARAYGEAIEQTAAAFMADHCKQAEPPMASAPAAATPAPTTIAEALGEPKPNGKDLAKRANDEARAEGNKARFGLGAGGALTKSPPTITVLNDPPAAPAAPATPTPAPQQTASAAGAAKSAPLAKSAEAQKPVPAGQKCRVWTASYGGDRAIIIRSVTGDTTNFTVLDVNAGQESREAEAYIAAYAKGGAVAFEFASQPPALDKAFELCPEG